MVRHSNYKGQVYKDLKEKAQQDGRLFVDTEFPPDASSLFYSKTSAPFAVEWKRPKIVLSLNRNVRYCLSPSISEELVQLFNGQKDICTDPQMFVDGASSADVSQGKLGNCWFVAACASLAQEDRLLYKVIPDHKEQIFNPEKPEEYQGIFRFRFWRFGEWIEVVVDDLLPTNNNELIYVKSKERNEFWSALLEKAYAKLAGSYEALEAGNPAEALVDFTGGVSETVDLVQGNHANDLEKRKELFQKLYKYMDRESLVSASIKVTNRDEMEQRLNTGLIKGHAYGITAVKKIPLGDHLFAAFSSEKLFMVKLRNPWGAKEWNGPWSDGSEEWNKVSKKEKQKLGITVEDDGEFWMAFEDFTKHFTTVTACRLVNTSYFSLHKTWHEGFHRNRWVSGSNAGGCINNKDSFLLNPQYRFDVTGNEKDVVMVSLLQRDRRYEKSLGKQGQNLTMGFFIMQVEANREYKVHSIYEKVGDSVFINSREIFGRYELDPGRYVIIPSTFEPNKDGEFLLRVYTGSSGHFRYLDQDKPQPGCMSWCPIYRMPTVLLSVFVVSVNRLSKKSGASVTVDPYVIMECEGTKVRTPTKKDVTDADFEYGGLFYIKKPETAMLNLEVWDHNTLMPDTSLGEISLPIRANDKTFLETHKLKEKGKAGELIDTDGSITIRVSCSHKMTFM